MTPRSTRQGRSVSAAGDGFEDGMHSRSEQFLARYRELRANVNSSIDTAEIYEHELSCLLEAAVPVFCDWCAIDLLDADDSMERFASRSIGDPTRVEATIKRRIPDLYTIVRRALDYQSSETYPSNDATALPNCIVVGLRVNDAPFGTVTFALDEKKLSFSTIDVAAAHEAALIVSDAVERSILHRDTRDAVRRTQRIASQLHQLIATSIAVAGLHSEQDILRRFAQSARNVFDADRALVSLERGPLAPLVGIAERNKTARYARPDDEPTLRELSTLRASNLVLWSDACWCVAPLLVNRAASRGSIAIERDQGSGFSAEEREVLTLLAQMASTALGALELSRTIQRSEVRWRVLVETAPVGIVEVDPEGSIRWWNRAAAKIFAWSDFTEIFEGSGPELPPTVKERFLDLWSEALRGTLEGSRDLHDVEINGRQRHLNVSAVPLPSAGTETRSLLTLVDDVTNQRELKQELRHAHQMELRGQVASSVAHDFNNLLTLISGYAEILSQDLGGDNREMEMVRNIQSTASRASQLTGQLQAIGRTQSTESVVVDPVELIRANAEVLERIMGVDIRVTWLLDAGVANVKVDADQFEQMILNLAINARDAMPVGGRLTITARNETVDARISSILELPAGNYVVVSVADTGIGMDEETRRRCFEPLFTTKGPFNGTGMGLAAARRFVEESGGVIQCTSELQRGTSFDVLLPAVLDAAATSASHDEIARPRGSATVLLADDDEGLRTLMAQVLGRNGYVVIEAGSAEEALELARARTSPIDVLISDVVMGALSGPELARSLQKDDPLLRVLLISGTADATVVELLAEGTGQFLAKPFKPSELIDEVHGLLERPGPSS